MSERKTHSAEFKANVALEALISPSKTCASYAANHPPQAQSDVCWC